jgi:Spy/CpxP family protein refolding chaperone
MCSAIERPLSATSRYVRFWFTTRHNLCIAHRGGVAYSVESSGRTMAPKGKSMRRLTIAAALTAVAFVVTAPVTLAQGAPKADMASPPASSYGCEMGNGMMGGNVEGHRARWQGMRGGGPGMMMGGPSPGMMGGGPMMMGMGMYAALDLTDEQRAKIARIFEDVRKKNWDTMGKVMDESATLRDLYNAPTHDPAAIGRQTVKIAELKRPIIESMVTAHDQIEALLTIEQKDRLRDFEHGRMMYGE